MVEKDPNAWTQTKARLLEEENESIAPYQN